MYFCVYFASTALHHVSEAGYKGSLSGDSGFVYFAFMQNHADI